MSAPRTITIIGSFAIRPGNADKLRENCKAMVALCEDRPGHLSAAYSFDGDTAATSREDYENAEAVLLHMKIGHRLYESTSELVDIKSVEIHGPADELEKLRALFGDHAPRFFATEFGFG
ncbi:MAG: antibiotic biosynthesis monooxygenase [Pseudomonadota bacterium]